MLEKLHFAAAIDLPLAAATLLGFLLHFNTWAHSNTADTSVDLAIRLPAARFRVVCFFVGLVLLCWITNFAVWAVFALLLALGFAVSMLAGGEGDGGGVFLLFARYAIREWAFGFPQLVLQPPQSTEKDSDDSPSRDILSGMRGRTVSPLRPCGEADVEGRVVPVMSDDGELLDAGKEVVVIGKRNGIFRVRPVVNEGTILS